MSETLIPAVVLGIETPIGLTIIRDLGQHGVPVIGIARSADAIGMASRYLRRGLLRADGEAALIEQLLALREEIGAACLFAISESDIALLNRHRPRLGDYVLMFADEARMALVLNKERTYAAAVKVGLRVPRTWQPASAADAHAMFADTRFPVVLKWANPNEAARALRGTGLALDKTHYCDTPQALQAYLGGYDSVGIYPLVQEYCAGHGLGQFILMKNGHAHQLFQHRRLHEWPPEGGFSSMCETVPREEHQALMQQSVALLRELDWQGIAMVEYRHDPATGASALMEINGRYWGSLPLAHHAGMPFAWLAYCLDALGQPPSPQAYRGHVRCRFMIPETKRLLRILFRPGLIADKSVTFARLPALAGYVAGFFDPRGSYYVFSWRDPAPFLRDIGAAVRTVLRLPRATPALPEQALSTEKR